ncbi:SCO-spondin-like isoform X3 [Branchiostoma lanceolatum]|uniref:SCO-spondin-like isoform X3 n=1 Tax=Branchiostoma lanceolatum TaxID=7740 RepID=UPI0034566E7D
MANLLFVALLVASTLLANVNGYMVQGPCPDDENGRPHHVGDQWNEGCYSCNCFAGGYGCNQRFPTCTYPVGCEKVYNDDGCELMAVMENQVDQVCDPIYCVM